MEYLETRRAMIEDRLEAVLDRLEPSALEAQLQHVALSGGKRVRPTITILACELVGGTPDDALDFAAGIELVHNASLVIDDIIDDSRVRRGKQSAWAEYGYGGALVASDGLMGEAFALFSPNADAMRTVADAIVHLGEGETIELVERPGTEADYMHLARRKTGALFRAAARVGAIAGGANDDTVTALGQYAERVGIAFQIRDDVLDAVADSSDLGKPTGQDAAMKRPSLVQVTDLTPSEANARARDQSDRALDALDAVEPQNETAEGYLADLAEFVVNRTS